MAAPMKPRNRPETESPQPRKFKKKVEGITYRIISTGMSQPINKKIRPTQSRKRGELIMTDTASKLQSDLAPVQNPKVLFDHINRQSLLNSADGNDSLWVGSPNWAARPAALP